MVPLRCSVAEHAHTVGVRDPATWSFGRVSAGIDRQPTDSTPKVGSSASRRAVFATCVVAPRQQATHPTHSVPAQPAWFDRLVEVPDVGRSTRRPSVTSLAWSGVVEVRRRDGP